MHDPTESPKINLLQRLFKKLSGVGQVAEVDTQQESDTENPNDEFDDDGNIEHIYTLW